jgi:two-component system sensor histidine kinase FlrB
MQLISHQEPIIAPRRKGDNGVGPLRDAFQEFIVASSRLEGAYDKLQLDITRLSHELADRNAALKLSLAENERVHQALQQVVDSMPCGVLVVEDDGRVSMINPEGRRLLEIGDNTADHLDGISLQSGVDLARFLKDTSDNGQEREFCKSSPSGKRWLSVTDRRSLPGSEIELRGRRQTILILRDITLHKQAELERERARKATALAEVATTLAHEIRNPLTSLELFAGLIGDGGSGVEEWVSHLRAGIRCLSGTVNNVLSFHGVGFPSLSALDLTASIRSSVEFVRPIAEQASIALLFDSTQAKLTVNGNSSALQQVVMNIVCNAIRHTSSGGSVTIQVREGRRANGSVYAAIEFSDTGCGIPPQDLENIFRAGFSVSGNTSGLGLAVCAQIIKQHEGEIRVISQLGVGTTFNVEIPVI